MARLPTRFHYLPVLVVILLLGFFFRFYGLNWDQSQHLHPDERFLTMVVTAMKLPINITEYFDPQLSLLNPYNLNFSFFVYGTLPLVITKIIGQLLNYTEYWNVFLVGRVLSAVLDLGVVILIYRISKTISGPKAALGAAFIYSVMVLPIQLSHFFAVDTFVNFFVVLTLFLTLKYLPKHPFRGSLLAGGAFALALACKISALYFSPVIAFLFVYSFLVFTPKLLAKIVNLIVYGLLFLFSCFFIFRLIQPHLFQTQNIFSFSLEPRFISNLKELTSYSDKNSWYPPGIQWKTTRPLLFPLTNLALWGLGVPLFLVTCLGLILQFWGIKKNIKKLFCCPSLFTIAVLSLWLVAFFLYQGSQHVKTMRYFLILYPILAILAGEAFARLLAFFVRKSTLLAVFFIFAFLAYPLSFMSIYTHQITRVAASEWIYRHIPSGSTLTYELWDDPLPLSLPGYPVNQYQLLELKMFDKDSPEKWQDLSKKLSQVDYLVMSSNRLHGTIPKHPEYYPQSSVFYQSLLANTHPDFKKIAEFTSRPCFPPVGSPLFCLVDDFAEEAFTVYDHPKVLIYQKTL
ncbi:MAG: glycosyltransferase family 39 protein [Candidatus Shapirobacteria bacterium]|jgi:4-amino-4-deoxy-L-arabinose transferase-like glycosyltransferase